LRIAACAVQDARPGFALVEDGMTTEQETPKRSVLSSAPTFGPYPQLIILARLIANAFRALSARIRSNKKP
jgi:hypothetical protein